MLSQWAAIGLDPGVLPGRTEFHVATASAGEATPVAQALQLVESVLADGLRCRHCFRKPAIAAEAAWRGGGPNLRNLHGGARLIPAAPLAVPG